MTPTPSNLTDEQLRVLVAEERGWTEIRESTPWECCDEPPRIRTIGRARLRLHGLGFQYVPAYPTSLDACAEFERGLTDEEYAEYHNEVCKLIESAFPKTRPYSPAAIARQRCIAYLKVKGKL